MQNFFTTPVGSYVKAFLIIVLAFVIQNGSIWTLNWKDVISASVISFLPMAAKALTGATGGFWNSAYGTYVKSALTLAIAFIVQSGSIYGLDYKTLINVIVMGLATVILNAANPGDPRYGFKKA
jgi:hypothetical protein